jgi:hypothetical protein
MLTPYVRNIKLHRTGGPGLANASQVPVNTGDSEGHPCSKMPHGAWLTLSLPWVTPYVVDNKQPEQSSAWV